MKDQLAGVTEPPGDEIIYPLWAWHSFYNCRSWDMLYRSSLFSRQLHRDNVFIVFELPTSEVLLSRYDLWTVHCMSLHYYLPSRDEYAEIVSSRHAQESRIEYYERTCDAINEKHSDLSEECIKLSWNNIFDLGHHDHDYYPCPAKPPFPIQACFWSLRLKDVKRTFSYDDFPIRKDKNTNGIESIDGVPMCCWDCSWFLWEPENGYGFERPVCTNGMILPTRRGDCSRIQRLRITERI